MRKTIILLLTSLFVALSASAHAVNVGIGLKASTLGLGAEVGVRVVKLFGVRAVFNKYDYSKTINDGGVDYDGDLNLQTYGVMADLYPTAGQFRLTGGAFKNDNALVAVAVPTDGIEIGSSYYPGNTAGVLTGDVSYNPTGWYLGLGYGDPARSPGRVHFLFDFGVVFQGSPGVRLTSSSSAVSADDLQQEAAQFQDDIETSKYWPVLSFGIGIRVF